MTNSKTPKQMLTRRNLLVSATIGGTALAIPAALLPSGTAFASTQDDGGWDQEGLLTGKQFQIRSGKTSAVITEEGAGLREFVVDGHEILDTYTQDQVPPGSNGQVLIPFPNRIDGGTYTFNGVAEQLDLSEPANTNAIHGLTRWMNWSAAKQEKDALTLSIVLHAQDGYPFVLGVRETYRVLPGTLLVQTSATNLGSAALPYGVGHHPYLTVGSDYINTDILQLPANSYFTTNSRLIPILPAVPVTGTPYDFRTPHAIGTTVMDTGFADLIYDKEGFFKVNFSAPGGKPAITLFADHNHKFLQVYTGDTLSDPTSHRRGLAVEPYTCAANAFNNLLGLITLQPGQSFTSSWGISVSL